ncbi:anaphase-promoting complex subunit 3 [Acrasis kona]|uniref:Anaphase-promoting complex subunit 3 n=1 Tax=Acrasis kona TaxID=1008807 RepID=A0AAW2YKY2_9EUKA
MEDYLRGCVLNSLQLHLYSNAIFLCERWFAESQTIESLHTLATCYYQSGQVKIAYHFMKETLDKWCVMLDAQSSTQTSAHYLFATLCIKMQLYEEAEKYLMSCYAFQGEDSTINYWLGVICRYTNRRDDAVSYLRKSLEGNPFMWCAFENLVQLGEHVKLNPLFSPSDASFTPFSSPVNVPTVLSFPTTPTTFSHSSSSTTLPTFSPIIENKTPSSSTITTNHAACQLVRSCAKAYQYACEYKLNNAVKQFQKLPPRHFNTGWVMCQLGKCYFELADYDHAEKCFEKMSTCEPYRLDGLEVYSTILWHMRKDARLSYLARRMNLIDPLSPNTMCAIGNCFSLQKDHASALKFFERAITTCPQFTYAHTLAGHEHFANDDMDDALECYRNAIRIDSRHYNAWYGLGTVYLRQEKYPMAELHFMRALSINDKSSVLYCYCGISMMGSHRYQDALGMLDQSLLIHPQNTAARFRRAGAFVAMNKHQEALDELDELIRMSPKEGIVHYETGKLCAKMGKKKRAMHHFIHALDLENPTRDSPFIMDAMRKLLL